MTTLVMKFGGSAIGTVTAMTQVMDIVLDYYQQWDRLLLIASALDGVTDQLLEAAHFAQSANQRGYRRIAATLRTRHLALAMKLPLNNQERRALQADTEGLIFDMIDSCQTLTQLANQQTVSLELNDRIIGIGEKLAARIIAALLRTNDLRGVAIDGTDIMVTSATHRHASPLLDLTREKVESTLLPLMEQRIIPVITGFIGSTPEGIQTTLGRGGSDYTASVLAACIQADELWIWSDVDGMMSADPQMIRQAQVIPELSYDEVAELAYFGARILHTRMIHPLRDYHIPLRIKNVHQPEADGTLIHNRGAVPSKALAAVTVISGISLSANRSGNVERIMHTVNAVFMDYIGIHPDVTITSQSSGDSFLCFVVPTSLGGIDVVDRLQQRIAHQIGQLGDAGDWYIDHVSIITAIGEHLGTNTRLIAQILQSLDGMQLLGMTQGASQSSFSVIAYFDDRQAILERIHSLMLSND